MLQRRDEPFRIAFLLAPQFSMMAFSAAMEPLRSANRVAERRIFEWQLISLDGDAVTASNGIPVDVHKPLEQLHRADMLVVCVGLDPLQYGRNQKVHHELRRLARHGSMVGGISGATFVLADAGLLVHRRCTVHWEYAEMFRARHPTLNVTQDLYVVDRDVFTCSGGTAALDMMLHFIADTSGPALARAVAEQFIHSQIRGEKSQQRLALHARYRIDSPKLVELIALMEASIDDPFDVLDIAAQVGISARQAERLFREHVGISPHAFYLQLRIAKARVLLRQTPSPIRTVALECGFTSTSHFCHAYKRVFGHAPMEERTRYGAY